MPISLVIIIVYLCRDIVVKSLESARDISAWPSVRSIIK